MNLIFFRDYILDEKYGLIPSNLKCIIISSLFGVLKLHRCDLQ